MKQNSIKNGTVIVTGGDKGMGLAISMSLINSGFRVLSVALEMPEVENDSLIGFKADLTDTREIETVARNLEPYKPVALVHNAGALRPALLPDVAVNDILSLTNLHVSSAMRFSQVCLPFMKERNCGRIILISSRAAMGLETRTAYSATKAAQLGMIKTWALELGSAGITANVIAPGPIATDLFRNAVPRGSEKEKRVLSSIPVRRLGNAEDIARTVLFLIDDAASFITGQTIFVCGGVSVGSLQL